MAPPLVCLDPGHGGSKPGALGADIFGDLPRPRECDYTLIQALAAESFIRAAGFRTMATRRTDETVANRERARMANDARADVFVSIHWNSSTAEYPDGTLVLAHRDSPRGLQLAEILLEKVGGLDGEAERWEKVLEVPDPSYRDGLVPAVIGETAMPAVLLEVEFASNPDELRRMLSTPYQLAVARAIAESLEEWWTG